MVQKNSINNKIIIICGPTASGKTTLAVDLAKKLNTEVISADSMLIYKGFDIGTAKPTLAEMQGITHHMIDVVDGNSQFSVSDYKERTLPIINNLLNQGKTPIICGGTGFYINSILFGFSYGNSTSNSDIRGKYNNYLEENGNIALFDLLKKRDPLTAEKLHYNDVKRVIRALEIYEISGKPKSSYIDDGTPNYDYVAFSYDYDREVLYSRINQRVDLMFENGLLDEVKKLINNGILQDAQAMQGIGYKETIKYLTGETSYDDMLEEIKQNSRRYAKRQITFFKKLANLNYLKPHDNIYNVIDIINKHGESND